MWEYPSTVEWQNAKKKQSEQRTIKQQRIHSGEKKTKQFWFKNEIANPYITFGPLIKKNIHFMLMCVIKPLWI